MPLKTKQLSIVLIDDNLHLRTSLAKVLADMGHDVEAAATAEAGLQLARERQPDLVICDIALQSEMNGYGVARTIKLNTRLASTFLVALSGNSSQEDRERSASAGFDRHLAKPAAIDDIQGLLDDAWLHKLRRSRQG
jgi:CheY-like chemotaxis protein